MGIDVGTLVQPYEAVEFDGNEAILGRTCKLGQITDQCIGIITELNIADDPEYSELSTARVRWVQSCPNHSYQHNLPRVHFLDALWEIGQLY